jgi:hypothetical protein
MRGEEARPVKPERDDLGFRLTIRVAFLALALILLALALLAMACAFGVEMFAAFMAGFEEILVRLMR